MTKVTITLTGSAGAGKTTLARHLAAYLKHEHGFTDLELRDECIMGGEGIEVEIPDQDDAEFPVEFNPEILIRVGEKP